MTVTNITKNDEEREKGPNDGLNGRLGSLPVLETRLDREVSYFLVFISFFVNTNNFFFGTATTAHLSNE